LDFGLDFGFWILDFGFAICGVAGEGAGCGGRMMCATSKKTGGNDEAIVRRD
jgi:hypothetical protein